MTDLHIPTHIDMTRRIAVQETATVTDLTVTEQQLRAQYDEHQREAAAERDRIEAELRAVREQADKRLAALADDERRLAGELTDVGRRLQQHRDEAEQAQQSIADWCTRQGVSPGDLPPLRDTGPMPVVAARQVVDLDPFVGEDVIIRTRGGQKIAGHLESASPARLRQLDGVDCLVDVELIVEIQRVAVIDPPPGFDTSAPLVVTHDPLPAIDGADALLEQGRRMADPGTTRTDLPGGDQPIEGGFQGDTDA